MQRLASLQIDDMISALLAIAYLACAVRDFEEIASVGLRRLSAVLHKYGLRRSGARHV